MLLHFDQALPIRSGAEHNGTATACPLENVISFRGEGI